MNLARINLSTATTFGHYLLGFALFFISACHSADNTYESKDPRLNDPKLYKVKVSENEFVVQLAITSKEQSLGLSGIKGHQWKDNWGMLFINQKESPKSFWMPDTYMDLDIFFLNKNLQVVHIERNMKAHPGRQEPPPIMRTPTIIAQYILELKSSSELSKKIKLLDKLNWLDRRSLQKIQQDTHSQK
ncbi:MAG: DUF192 domain-containing protein [Bacteriovoracaceae bacterium]